MSSQRKQGCLNSFVKQKVEVFGLEPILAESQCSSVIARKKGTTGRTGGQALDHDRSQYETRVSLRACLFSLIDILYKCLQICSFHVLN